MLALAPNVVFLHEPFHVRNYRPGICNLRFDRWFTYIKRENEAPYYRALRDTFALRYNLVAGVRHGPVSPARWRSQLHRYLSFAGYRLARKRALIKDPIAVLSAEYLAERFDMKVIVLVRHPAAFVHSLLKAGWQHPFADFLDQPLLMKDHLGRFKDQISKYAHQPASLLDQACLLWRIIYAVVAGYQDRHADWLFVRHEDVSMEPVRSFREMYSSLGLEFSADCERRIEQHSAPGAGSGLDVDPAIVRDSRANVRSWHTGLGAEQVTYIRGQVEDVSRRFYSAEDWS